MDYDGIGSALQAGLGSGVEPGAERIAQAERLRQGEEHDRQGASEESFDSVSISSRGRELAAEMSERTGRGEESDNDRKGGKDRDDGEATQKGGQNLSGMSIGEEDTQSEKEEAVEELKDTNADLKDKKQELQEAKASSIGTEDEREQKIKDLKQDISDLEDTKQELESTLAS